jgi:hypothetical protein
VIGRALSALCLALALCACASTHPAPRPAGPASAEPAADQAGNRLEMLVARGEKRCTADGVWCVDGTGLISHATEGERWALATHVREDEETAAWPLIVRIAGQDRVLVGQTYRQSDMYAGGGAWVTWLTLYDVSTARDEALAVVSVVVAGSASIRACFDADDRRARREACTDEYSFGGALALDTTTQSGMPRLIYTTTASTYPGRRTRADEATEISRSALRWVTDEACSYRRVFAWTPDGYTPDQPLPECSDYLTQ